MTKIINIKDHLVKKDDQNEAWYWDGKAAMEAVGDKHADAIIIYALKCVLTDCEIGFMLGEFASEEFIDIYRYRSGVEATMSQYNTLTGVKRLRVRGLNAVHYCATLKAVGLNLLRAASVQNAQRRLKEPKTARYRLFHFSKSKFISFCPALAKFCCQNRLQSIFTLIGLRDFLHGHQN